MTAPLEALELPHTQSARSARQSGSIGLGLAVGSLACLLARTRALATEEPTVTDSDDHWELAFSPYLWATSLTGEATVRGTPLTWMRASPTS